MYILEKLEFQGTEKCPQMKWKQLVMCYSREPLEKLRSKQSRQSDWRITKTAFDELPYTKSDWRKVA